MVVLHSCIVMMSSLTQLMVYVSKISNYEVGDEMIADEDGESQLVVVQPL